MDTKKIEQEIIKQYKTVKKFSRISQIPYTTLKSALDKGIGGTSVRTVIKICDL